MDLTKTIENMTVTEAREALADAETLAAELRDVFNKQPAIPDSPAAASLFEDHPYCIGKSYLIRTVTMIYTGRLVAVGDKELTLEQAAWIADTGRFGQALRKGASVFNDVEPYLQDRPVLVGRGAIVDAQVVDFELPTKTK